MIFLSIEEIKKHAENTELIYLDEIKAILLLEIENNESIYIVIYPNNTKYQISYIKDSIIYEIININEETLPHFIKNFNSNIPIIENYINLIPNIDENKAFKLSSFTKKFDKQYNELQVTKMKLFFLIFFITRNQRDIELAIKYITEKETDDYKNKLKMLLYSMNIDEIKNIITDYNQDKIHRTEKIRSSQTKEQMIKELLLTLDSNEVSYYYEKYKKEFSNKLLQKSILFINGQDKKERIVNIIEKPNFIMFEIKGFSWDVSTKLEIINNEITESCSCGIFKSGGICIHLYSIYIYKYITDKTFQTLVLPFELELNKDIIKNVVLFDTKPDIVFKDKLYNIYVSKSGYHLKYEWFAEFSGVKVLTFNSKEEMEETLKEKVFEYMTKYKKEGIIRYIVNDNYGIVNLILSDKNYISKFKKILIEKMGYKDDEITLKLIEELMLGY